jgi:hypothetical protein
MKWFVLRKFECILFLNSLFDNGLFLIFNFDTTMNDTLLTFFEWQM